MDLAQKTNAGSGSFNTLISTILHCTEENFHAITDPK